MINVNQLTAQLRMMPDQALQRVAMMYKQDPYILPLVISESMARKKLRAAGQAQAAQPQAKVADQAIMAMIPEESGIAGLAAPNMEGMADGGIAGYAEGGMANTAEDSFSRGGMFDFAQRSEPVIRMAGGGVPGYNGAEDSFINRLPEGSGLRKLIDWYSSGKPSLSRPLLDFEPPAYPTAEEAEMKRLMSPYKPRRTGDKKLAALEDALIEQRAKDKKDAEEKPVAQEKKPSQRPTAAPVPAAPVAAAPAPASETAIKTYAAPTPEATAAGIAALSKAPDEATKAAFAELKAMYEPERKELEERKGKRGAEALLRAGLAMMSGTSPYAMANIGKGGIEGLNAYQEAQRYDDQAARSLRQAEISMRLAQRQEQAGNRRDAISLFGQAQQQEQAAATSAQNAQQIKQSGAYQQGALAVMQQNANTNAKLVGAKIAALNAPEQQRKAMMIEYGKLQKTVMQQVGKDTAYLTETDPAKKQKIFDDAMKAAVAQNPFLSATLFLGAPRGPVRELTDKDTDTEE